MYRDTLLTEMRKSMRKMYLEKFLTGMSIFIVGYWWIFSGSGQWTEVKRQIITRTGTIYFVDNKSLFIYAFGLAIIIGLIATEFPKFKKVNRFTMYASFVTLCCGLAIILELFMYSYITPEGIYHRDGVWRGEKYYSWDQVTSVDIGYRYQHSKYSKKDSYYLEYIVNLYDGTMIELSGTKDFFPLILYIDRMFSEKKVPIHRRTIDSNEVYYGLKGSLPERYFSINLKLLNYVKKGPPETR